MNLIKRGWAWALDYAYVGFWQVHALLVRADPAAYLVPPEGAPGGKAPVLLIPGIYETWQFMRPVAEHLHRAGHPVHVVQKLGYNRGTVEAMAQLAAGYLEEHDLTGVVIVAHSKGGLIGKFLMTMSSAGGRVSRLVAINTPFSGSIYASFFILPSIRAFSPQNPTLRTLRDNRALNGRITSIYGRFDPHIPAGSFVDGARNIQLDTMGHFRPIADARVLQEVDRAIAAGEQ
ncbi:alpha/beta hydrolase [Arthrobacter agilis]|uniref:esterase/lipase family protein n=1 Tax=Arthrobacter agilis TaxID=37921 RepID=UPI000B358E38|nr:alpha/beta hydrolase [Arthrobacter agilis]OUM42899.1 alpha/beta hydrolase [Arthrobacter agilis]PPB45844.1 alpha/beta hydrolase [Arthrobacter agilis]TPV25387.1 alpha/beta hydrolase [Arthrobacter agilis]